MENMNEHLARLIRYPSAEQLQAALWLRRRFSHKDFEQWVGSVYANLWLGQTFSGCAILDSMPGGHAAWPADLSTWLMRMWDVRNIESGRFNPSVSASAFLGLSECNRGKLSKPTLDHAYAWDWHTRVDFSWLSSFSIDTINDIRGN
jgi:hypothetical protein